MIIYRLDLTEPPTPKPLPEGSQCFVVSRFPDVLTHFSTWVANWGVWDSLKTALKVLSGKRVLYFSVLGKKLVQSGWANLGFCRYYPVEPNAVVFGTLYTRPEFRSLGFSTGAKSHMLNYLYTQGYRRFYADTTPANVASQRTSEKLGFTRIAS